VSLVRTASRSVLWAFLATAASRLIWLLALAVLTRWLSPDQFGLFGVGLVVLLYMDTVGDLGTGAALVFWPDREEMAAEVTFRVNLGVGILFTAALLLAAPAVAGFFRQPDAVLLLRVLAPAFLLRSLGNTHDALCRKHLRFRARLVPELTLALGKAGVAVALALTGFGVWSLVAGQLTGLALWSLSLWRVVDWRPRWPGVAGAGGLPGGVRELVGPMLRYGRGILAVDVLSAVVHHADVVVVGRMLGTAALGLYQIAAKVPETTVTVAVWVVGKVLFPAFARLHAARDRMDRAYLAVLRHVSLLTLPAAAGMMLVAEPLVGTVFGDDWRAAAPVLRALAAYAGVRSLGSNAGDLLKGTGRTGWLAGLAGLKAALLLPCLVLAGRGDLGSQGPAAVAWALAAVSVVNAGISVAVASRLTGVTAAGIGRALAPAAAATCGMAITLALWMRWGPPLSEGAELAVRVTLGFAVYTALLMFLAPGVLHRMWQVLRQGGETPALAERGG
jgi:lipopolysaccharide exporter